MNRRTEGEGDKGRERGTESPNNGFTHFNNINTHTGS